MRRNYTILDGNTVNPKFIWGLYEKAMSYNSSVHLDETVRVNENFYIGRQWEGVEARGLPTPQFNFLKRVVGFVVASITSDDIHVSAAPLSSGAEQELAELAAKITDREFEALTERNNIPSLLREFTRNAAVDGDACLYTYWDMSVENGQSVRGGIKTELIENNRVFFGNPGDRRPQTQPYIIISGRMSLEDAKLRAAGAGIHDLSSIVCDRDDRGIDDVKKQDDMVTTLLFLWRDKESGRIFSFECTKTTVISPPKDLGLRLYPVCWLNWDYVQGSYHGQAMITGLIPNQIFVNKIWALSMLSFMKTAYPKYIYDKTRIKNWDNRVGAAIGVNGGDMNNVAKVMEPAVISPQISQFISLAVEQTERSLGATSAALGDTKPDNSSAIIALQRAAAIPTELTKQNLYACVEELYRIYLEFMGEYYGIRPSVTDSGELIFFDFGVLKDHPMNLRLDVGASSYYSEIAALQTLDRLLAGGHISALQYLERIPDGYVPGRRALINELRAQTEPQLKDDIM